MISFFILAAFLVIALVGILLYTLFSGSNNQPVDLRQDNVAIARQKKAQLEQALSSGAMDKDTYESELATVERRLAIDLSSSTTSTDGKAAKISLAVLLCAFVPIAATLMYLKVGTPDALMGEIPIEGAVADNANATENTAPDLATAIPQLEQKLMENPEDINGWKLLGRSYLMMGETPKAEQSMRTAMSHGHEDPDIWTLLAEANARQKDGDLRGEPTELLEKSVAADGIHERSYLLLGVARQQTGQHEEAIELFSTMLANGERGADATAQIQNMIAASETALGKEPAASAPEESSAPVIGVTVTVNVSEEALAASTPDQSVFIYARASSGPPMPLAVSRHQVKDLPVQVILDDSMAMVPDLSISKFDSITVGARISGTGNAIAQPGDWFVEKLNIEMSDTPQIEIEINEQKQ